MINKKSVLVVIPARGGSKGLPGKNIKDFCGKPLIVWTIEAALQSSFVDKVIVSTDNQDIAKIAEQSGALVPFIRPTNLATDETSSIDVIKHVLNFCAKKNEPFYDYTIMLEATSPLRVAEDIDGALMELIASPYAKSIVGISRTEAQNPAFLVTKDSKNLITGYRDSSMKVIRRQDIESVYFFEGSVYISDTTVLCEKNTFYHDKTLGYEFPKWKSLEIDDLDDFVMAEAIMKHRILKR